MELLWTIIIGFIVGMFARILKPGQDQMGFAMTTLLGIAGALVGGYFGRALGIYNPGEPAGFLASIVGAVLLLVLLGSFFRRRKARL